MGKRQWAELWELRGRDAAALGVIALFFVSFFPHAIFSGKFLISGDAFFYSYPLRQIGWEMIRRGQWPLWTPHIFSGYPLLSMAQLGFGYPLTWGYLFLPGHWAEQIYVLAPFLLAPAFTYAYAREVGRSRLAALLAGLAFAYGGLMASPLGNNGMLNNAVMWLPLLLVAVERARTKSFVSCLLPATGAYAMSVLSGIGQGFLYAGLLAVAYAAFVSLLPPAANERLRSDVLNWRQAARWWRPLAVACVSILLAAGVAAFQILETGRAARRSIRSRLDYETFAQGSFTPEQAVWSLLTPLYNYIDTLVYVAPLALVLAGVGVFAAWRCRAQQRDLRVFFWSGVAVVAGVLLLGGSTPLYRLVYHIPLVNRFRVPSRHVFEWTFALGVLAAYGWDAAAKWFAARRGREVSADRDRRRIVIALLTLLLCVACGVFWWQAAQPKANSPYTAGLREDVYLALKTGFAVLTLAAIWAGWRVSVARWRAALLAAGIAIGCFVEPSLYLSLWWSGAGLDAGRFAEVSPVTRLLQQYRPKETRVYTHVYLFDEYLPGPRFEGPNLTALHGLHNVAGYEPLVLERFSRALGGVGLDGVTPRSGYARNDDLFGPASQALEILNTRFLVTYRNFGAAPGPLIMHDGVGLALGTALGALAPRSAMMLGPAEDADADTLVFVTSLSYSTGEPDGQTIAEVRVHTADGRVIERELRAGVDTAEWAHERPGVRAGARHKLAPVFDSRPGDNEHSFLAYRFLARIPLGERTRVHRVEIRNVSANASLALWAGSAHDSAAQTSAPLRATMGAHWRIIYDRDNILVLENERALPRAWLVAAAEAVDGEEALRRIHGRGSKEFDPRQTALLEVRSDELPTLSGGAAPVGATAVIVEYGPNRLAIETDSQAPAVLVVSEMFYPGWETTVDGQPARIMLANFLLRGVAVPAGRHRVEMRYTAPGARAGLLISALTLFVLGGLVVSHYARRQRFHSSMTERATEDKPAPPST